jgi:hypothetical protein
MIFDDDLSRIVQLYLSFVALFFPLFGQSVALFIHLFHGLFLFFFPFFWDL